MAGCQTRPTGSVTALDCGQQLLTTVQNNGINWWLLQLIGPLMSAQSGVCQMSANPQADTLKRLEEERQQTMERLESLRKSLTEEVEPTTDEGYPDIYEREKNLALLHRLEQKLESIDRAVRLQQKGGYGVCERCGEAIDPERLEVLPDTTLCMKCKQEIERLARGRSIVGE